MKTQQLVQLKLNTCVAVLGTLLSIGAVASTALADSAVWHGESAITGIETGRGRTQIYLPQATGTELCPNTASNGWFEIDMSEAGAADMLETAYKAAQLGWNVKVRSNAPTCFNGYIRVEILQMLAP